MNQPPQSERAAPQLPPEEVKRLLRMRRKADQFDEFATDPTQAIRDLGRLALRRDAIDDYFALGDLCAQQSLDEGQTLRIAYVTKTFKAYRRAAEQATEQADHALAQRLIEDFSAWVVDCARHNPDPRNAAVALWVLAEEDSGLRVDAPMLRDFMLVYQRMMDPTEEFSDTTHLDDETAAYVSLLSQSSATMSDQDSDPARFDSLLEESSGEGLEATRVGAAPFFIESSVEQSQVPPFVRMKAETADDEFDIGQQHRRPLRDRRHPARRHGHRLPVLRSRPARAGGDQDLPEPLSEQRTGRDALLQ